jgi:hypothetical protein
LYEEGQLKVLSALYGRTYISDHHRDNLIQTTMSLISGGRGPVYARLSWDDNSGHAVQILKIENDRVYFRNPWGGSHYASGVGHGQSGPQRRVEDGANGIESISTSDFLAITESILIEKLD